MKVYILLVIASPQSSTMLKFTHTETKEMLKIMLLQHAVCSNKAPDWICQQNQQKPIQRPYTYLEIP